MTSPIMANREIKYSAKIHGGKSLEEVLDCRSVWFRITDKLGFTHDNQNIKKLWEETWGKMPEDQRNLDKAIELCIDFRERLPQNQKTIFDRALEFTAKESSGYFGTTSNLNVYLKDNQGRSELTKEMSLENNLVISEPIKDLSDDRLREHPLLEQKQSGVYTLKSEVADSIEKIKGLSDSTSAKEKADAYCKLAKAFPKASDIDIRIGALVIAREHLLVNSDPHEVAEIEGRKYLEPIDKELLEAFKARTPGIYGIYGKNGEIDFKDIPISVGIDFKDIPISVGIDFKDIPISVIANEFKPEKIYGVMINQLQSKINRLYTTIYYRFQDAEKQRVRNPVLNNLWDPKNLENVANLCSGSQVFLEAYLALEGETTVNQEATIQNDVPEAIWDKLSKDHPDTWTISKQNMDEERDFRWVMRDNEIACDPEAEDYLEKKSPAIIQIATAYFRTLRILISQAQTKDRSLQDGDQDTPEVALSKAHETAYNKVVVVEVDRFKTTMQKYHKARTRFLQLLGLPPNTKKILVNGLLTREVKEAMQKWYEGKGSQDSKIEEELK